MVFDSPDFDLAPYAGFDMPAYVQRTYCSWGDAGWRSLLVQCFDHAPEADHLQLPGVSDLHLVLWPQSRSYTTERERCSPSMTGWTGRPGRLFTPPDQSCRTCGFRCFAHPSVHAAKRVLVDLVRLDRSQRDVGNLRSSRCCQQVFLDLVEPGKQHRLRAANRRAASRSARELVAFPRSTQRQRAGRRSAIGLNSSQIHDRMRHGRAVRAPVHP